MGEFQVNLQHFSKIRIGYKNYFEEANILGEIQNGSNGGVPNFFFSGTNVWGSSELGKGASPKDPLGVYGLVICCLYNMSRIFSYSSW